MIEEPNSHLRLIPLYDGRIRLEVYDAEGSLINVRETRVHGALMHTIQEWMRLQQ